MTVTTSAISAAVSLIAGPGIADQFRRDVIALALLPVKPGMGENCTFEVKTSGRTTAAAHAEGADFSSFSTHTRLRGTLAWAEYGETARVTGKAEAVAASSGYANGNILSDELRDAVDSLAVKLGADVYAGNAGATPPQLAGAALAIDASDDDFAGIDTGVNTTWSSGENTGTLATFTLADIRTKLFRPIKDATGRNPGFVTTTGTVMDALQTRFDESALTRNVSQISVMGQTIDTMAVFGQMAVMLDGVPFIEDRHCTSGTLYGWSPEFVEVRQLTKPIDPNVNITDVRDALRALTGVDVAPGAIEQRIRAMNNAGSLIPRIEALAKTGDARKFSVTVKAQLAWKRRNAFAKLTLS